MPLRTFGDMKEIAKLPPFRTLGDAMLLREDKQSEFYHGLLTDEDAKPVYLTEAAMKKKYRKTDRLAKHQTDMGAAKDLVEEVFVTYDTPLLEARKANLKKWPISTKNGLQAGELGRKKTLARMDKQYEALVADKPRLAQLELANSITHLKYVPAHHNGNRKEESHFVGRLFDGTEDFVLNMAWVRESFEKDVIFILMEDVYQEGYMPVDNKEIKLDQRQVAYVRCFKQDSNGNQMVYKLSLIHI